MLVGGVSEGWRKLGKGGCDDMVEQESGGLVDEWSVGGLRMEGGRWIGG